MNTEPPQGDDLQRMLVSMKQNVLARAELDRPAPKRRGRRAGIVIGVIAVLGIGVGSGAVALGMVPQPFTAAPAPSPTVTEPPETPTKSSAPVISEPTATPTPTSTPTPTRTPAAIPTDCRALVPEADYDRLFGNIPFRESPDAANAGEVEQPETLLWCSWMDPRADVSGIEIFVGDGEHEGYAPLPNGYTCSDHDGGRLCQVKQPAFAYPVDTTYTFFTRDSRWVVIRQTNAPTNGLLAALEQQLWQ